jgi:hypothetical protein
MDIIILNVKFFIKTLVSVALFLLLILLCYQITEGFNILITKLIEESYFEGQKDALNNDIRIKKISDSSYIWISSPWNNNRKPLWTPDSISQFEKDK